MLKDPRLSNDASRRLLMIGTLAPDAADSILDAQGVESHHGGTLYLSLHTGATATVGNEADYPGYMRLVVPRSPNYWEHGSDPISSFMRCRLRLDWPVCRGPWGGKIRSVAARLPDGARLLNLGLDGRTILFQEALHRPFGLYPGEMPTVYSIAFRVKRKTI